MGRIVDSLKDFYKKQGGTPSDVRGIKSISGVIDKIANLSFGGGGGGNNDFVVTYTINDSDLTVTADKTFAEINAAFEAKKNVKGLSNDGQGEVLLSLARVMSDRLLFYGNTFITEGESISVFAFGFIHHDDNVINFGGSTLQNATT